MAVVVGSTQWTGTPSLGWCQSIFLTVQSFGETLAQSSLGWCHCCAELMVCGRVPDSLFGCSAHFPVVPETLVGWKAFKCLSLPSEDSSWGEGFTWAGINLLIMVLSKAQLLL